MSVTTRNYYYALYTKAIHGPECGQYVHCWSFNSMSFSIRFARQRTDVGDIQIRRVLKDDKGERLITTIKHTTF